MSLIHELQQQRPAVRYALFGFSAVITIAVIAVFWAFSFQEQVYMAMHPDPAEQQAYLARQSQNAPKPLAAISEGFHSLTASIGSLIGLDNSKGFDSGNDTDHNQVAHPLPLSR